MPSVSPVLPVQSRAHPCAPLSPVLQVQSRAYPCAPLSPVLPVQSCAHLLIHVLLRRGEELDKLLVQEVHLVLGLAFSPSHDVIFDS